MSNATHTAGATGSPAKSVTIRVRAIPFTALTPRECEVICLIAEGLSLPSVASRLKIARSTADTHRTRAYKKLGVRSCAEATRWAVRSGLVSAIARHQP